MEIELKARAPRDIGARLRRAGAKFLYAKDTKGFIYDTPSRALLRADVMLRVRETAGRQMLTMKKSVRMHGVKIARETEIALEPSAHTVPRGNRNSIHSLLRELGFKVDVTVVKKSRVYKLGTVKVFLDDVRGLGRWVEVEALTSNRRGGAEAVKNALLRLGISPKQWTSVSYPQMMRRLKRRRSD
jgi:predicted adenylyl cyclase CyaB